MGQPSRESAQLCQLFPLAEPGLGFPPPGKQDPEQSADGDRAGRQYLVEHLLGNGDQRRGVRYDARQVKGLRVGQQNAQHNA